MADLVGAVAQQAQQVGGQQGAGLSDAVQSGIQAAQMEQQIAGQKQAQANAAIDLQQKQASQLAGDARRVVWAPSNLQGAMLDQMEQRANQAQIPFDRTALEQVLKDPDQVNHIRSGLNDLATGKVSADPNFLMQTLGTVPGMTDYLQQTMGANSKIQNAAQAKLVEDRQKQDNELALGQQKGSFELQKQGLENQGKVAAAGATRGMKEFDQTKTALESMRGNPAAQQAEKDLYASQKISSLLDGDLDKKTPTEVLLATSEIAKMATGGVPSESELHGLTPNGLEGRIASAYQKLSSQPTAANQGALLKVLKNYTDKLSGDAQKVVQDRYGRILDSNKDNLTESQYNALQKNYLGRFDKPVASPSSATNPAPVVQSPLVQKTMSDPKFQALSPAAQQAILQHIGGGQ